MCYLYFTLQRNAKRQRSLDSDDSGEDRPIVRQDRSFTVRSIKTTHIRKFNTTSQDFMIRINQDALHGTLPEILHSLHGIFEQILHDLLFTGNRGNKYARFVIRSPHLDIPITIPMTPHRELTAHKILAAIERVAQSKKSFLLDRAFFINLIITKVPEGKGRRFKPNTLKVEDMIKSKKSIIKIGKGRDNLCLAKAICVAKMYVDFPSKTDKVHKKKRKALIQSTGLQLLGAHNLLALCGISDKKTSYDLSDVKVFQEKLKDYQIIVVSHQFYNAIVFQGPPSIKRLILYEANKHYHVITGLKAFFCETDFYCFVCMEKYRLFTEHAACRLLCKTCMHNDCFQANLELDWHYCNNCNRYFKNKLCFERHSMKPTDRSNAICAKFVKCKKCNHIVTRVRKDPDRHHCGLEICKSCNQWVSEISDEVHKCYVQPLKLDPVKDSKKKKDLYFFDIETDQSTFVHLSTLVVLQDEDGKTWYFEGLRNSIKEFCDFILTKQFSHSVILSHNGGNFDLYLLLEEIHKRSIKVETIYRVTTILQLTIVQYDITFRDTYLFIPTKLSNFPSLFGFDGAKSYFPHLYPYTTTYCGKYLDPIFYGYNSMSVKSRGDFLQWHSSKVEQASLFDYKADLLQYCINDCDILRKACLIFRELYLTTAYTDPWAETITLTHACSTVFRKCFLQPDTIALIPHHGYTSPRRYSTKGIKWLEYKAQTENIHISHARNDGEVKVLGYYVDGYSVEQGITTVFEFLGVSIQVILTLIYR